jgi:hypothetical protein
MVAACINADTGVGPAIASGNQVYNGICADLPQAQWINKKQQLKVDLNLIRSTRYSSFKVAYSKVENIEPRMKIPINSPKSLFCS